MKDEIIQFLKENIIGKNLFTDDVVYQLDNGKLEGAVSYTHLTLPTTPYV